LINIAANQQQQFDKLCELIGCKEIAADPRFANREDRKNLRHELNAEIETALAAKPAKEWAALLNQNGVPAGEVLSIPEVLEHPQIISRELIETFSSTPGVDREIAVVRTGFHLASGNPGPATPPPGLGADTDMILEELGYDKEAIAKLRNQGTV
jgi:crotonobetainyl-CoA:carnitine CoA-transferase CaiB-like acyl-CoA transferase